MANMSYCRFQNTATDLQDCYDSWEENDDLSSDEKRARTRILELCKDIVADFGDDDEEEE